MLLYQLMQNQQSHSLSLLLFLIITFFFVIISFSLIVLFTYFEITLWMVTYWTYLRCLCSYHNMSTVTAFPYLNFTLFKHLCSFNILKKCTISLFVVLLNLFIINKLSLPITIKKLFISYILVNDSTIETPVSFAVEQLKTSDVCKKKQ